MADLYAALAIKKRDYAIILLETMILGFAMMERPGLELWYNFILAYPLARVVSKPMTEKVLEFDAPEPALAETDSEPAQAEASEGLSESSVVAPADISPEASVDVPADISPEASADTSPEAPADESAVASSEAPEADEEA